MPLDLSANILKDKYLINVELFDTFSMKDKQQAVEEYKKKMLPMIFVLVQKIYAEIFRLLLSNNEHQAG